MVMLNAGFVVPKLARISLAMLEACQLPIWLNVYLSKPGLQRSTQLHTDKQACARTPPNATSFEVASFAHTPSGSVISASEHLSCRALEILNKT